MPEIKLVGKIKGFKYYAEESGEGSKRKEQAKVAITVEADIPSNSDPIMGDLAELSREFSNIILTEHQMTIPDNED